MLHHLKLWVEINIIMVNTYNVCIIGECIILKIYMYVYNICCLYFLCYKFVVNNVHVKLKSLKH